MLIALTNLASLDVNYHNHLIFKMRAPWLNEIHVCWVEGCAITLHCKHGDPAQEDV